MANKEDPSQVRSMSFEQAHKMKRDIVILEFQDQVSRLTKQIAQVKEAMREPHCFENSLDPN